MRQAAKKAGACTGTVRLVPQWPNVALYLCSVPVVPIRYSGTNIASNFRHRPAGNGVIAGLWNIGLLEYIVLGGDMKTHGNYELKAERDV